MYRFVDAAVVRAAARCPGSVPPWPDLTDDAEKNLTSWVDWLRQVWASDGFAASVEIASPDLARRVQEVCQGSRVRRQEVRRAVLSLIRYLLRSTSRATPFGLFSGVAPVRLGHTPAVRFGGGHRAVARVDSTWLDGVITRLEAIPELRYRLLVVRNNLAFVRDGRLVVGCWQSGAVHGTGPAEVSVRYTEAVHTVFQAAQTPVRLGDLADKLASNFPDKPDSVINEMLTRLVEHRLLVTSLRPPMTVTDPLGHVIEALTAVQADTVQGTAGLLDELCGIHADLLHHNATPPLRGRSLRSHVSRRMAALCTAERPIAVDLRLDGDLVLPHAVVREAERTAEALARLGPHPHGTPAWQDYHRRFCERYGLGSLVGIRELLDADSGLGFPHGYRNSRLAPPSVPGLSKRDMALLVLAQNAAVQQHTEVVIDDALVDNLAAASLGEYRVQPHTELRCRIYSPSTGALGRGEFRLAVTGMSRAAGTTAGRFLDLFDTGDQERMFRAYAELPAVCQNALRVQVSGPTVSRRAENITRSPAVLPLLVPLAEQCPDGKEAVSLDDLAVTADAQRLYLVSVSRRQPVEPILFSAVELTHHAQPLLRFLCEISTARTAACVPFSWGAASRLPFLPRIRYRRSILSPAMWTLTATDFPGSAEPWRNWKDRWDAWRDQFRVPASVYLGDGDRRIRLDLDESAHLAVLRADLARNGHATIREAPEEDEMGWIDGRAHDIVIPLAATAPPAAPQRTWSRCVLSRAHGHLPGSSEWLYVKLYGNPGRQTALLTSHLPALLAAWEEEPEWWFLRYHDPDKHLRLRIRLREADDFGQVAARVTAWTTELYERGLVSQVQFDTYYPETGRFGQDVAMAAAESVFAADSAAAVAQLRAVDHREGPHLHAVTAASMVDIAVTVAGSVSDGMRWLIRHWRASSAPAPSRETRDQMIRLADPSRGRSALLEVPGGEDIAASWELRRAALLRYRAALTAEKQISPDTVLADLLHLHHARMVGISPDSEWACRRLSRAAALSWTARTQGAL